MTRHNFKKIIPKAENRKRLSQGEQARALGVTREHLNRVLRGHRHSRRLLRDHARIFGGRA